MAASSQRQRLLRLISGLVWIAIAAVIYVLIDYSFRQSDAPEYRFRVPELSANEPVFLMQDNFMIVVARYDKGFLDRSSKGGRIAEISSSFSQQAHAVDQDGYLVVKGYGTHRGCPLEMVDDGFKETCSDAHYDWMGRSQRPEVYANLEKLDYYFSQNRSLLTIE